MSGIKVPHQMNIPTAPPIHSIVTMFMYARKVFLPFFKIIDFKPFIINNSDRTR